MNVDHRAGRLHHGDRSMRRQLGTWIIAFTAALGFCRSFCDVLFNGGSRRIHFSRSTQSPQPLCLMRPQQKPARGFTIRSYLSQMNFPDHWVLYKWKPDGSFDHVLAQPTSLHPNWEPARHILGDAPPSEFGRIVLLMNSDQISFIPWDIPPPVPIWVFSKPKSTVDPKLQNITQDSSTFVQNAWCGLVNVTLVPTPYDTGNYNKFCVDSIAEKVTSSFTEKLNKVVWRGVQHWPQEAEQSRAAALDFAKLHANESWLDVEEAKEGRSNRLDLHELAEFRYHLDLGGLSGTSWGGLRWKLCSGLLVFKVESWADDWWHETLEPWKHYIPVRADVSDLREQYQWTQAHPEETIQIAAAGQQKCLETLGPDKALQRYRSIVKDIPAADQALVEEADDLLKQMVLLNSDMGGVFSQTSKGRY